MTESGRVRIGVVGAGWWATTAHLPALVADARCEVVGLADLNGDRARLAAQRFGVPFATQDYRALLGQGLDCVVVATPHDSHFEIARAAMLSGADVLVEKPMVIGVDDGRELVSIARRSGRRLHVDYPFLFTRHARVLSSAVETGILGQIVLATALFATNTLPFYRGEISGSRHTRAETMWPTSASTWSDPQRGGGHLYSQITHAAALLLFLSKLRPVIVFAVDHGLGTAVDVWNAITFQAGDGAAGSLTGTGTVGAPSVEEYRIFGTRGHAALSTSEGTLALTEYGRGVRHETVLQPDEIYPMTAPIDSMVTAAINPESVEDTADLGLLSVELLAAARESARQAASVVIPQSRRVSKGVEV